MRNAQRTQPSKMSTKIDGAFLYCKSFVKNSSELPLEDFRRITNSSVVRKVFVRQVRLIGIQYWLRPRRERFFTMIQFLRFRVVLPKLRSCLTLSSEQCPKISQLSYYRIPTRSYMNRISEKYETKLKTRDMVPEGFNLIYRGGMDYYIHLANNGSNILLLLGFLGLAKVVFDTENIVQFPTDMGEKNPLVGLKSYGQYAIMSVTFFAMMWSMRLISVRYVLRMYYNPTTKTYRAIKVGFLPMAISWHDFQSRTLIRISKKYIIPWKNAQYKSNGQCLLIFEHGFRTSADYDRMFAVGSKDIEDEIKDDDIPKYEN